MNNAEIVNYFYHITAIDGIDYSMLNFSEIKKVHFIGIGGVSLSSLALLMRSMGIDVSGSDRTFSERLLQLSEYGCEIAIGSRTELLKNADIVIFSSAIEREDVELCYARELGIPTYERYLFLREVESLFRYTVAVSGTHGKTTTTAMLTKIFCDHSLKFFGHIGGDVKGIGNFYFSGADYFLTEACEYRKSFLALNPDFGLILNVENDHPDTYRTLSELYDCFDEYADHALQKGFVIANGDCLYYRERLKHKKEVVTFGLQPHNSFLISHVREYEKGYFKFEISQFGLPLASISLSVPGYHNIYNATAAFIVPYLLKLCPRSVEKSLSDFSGVKRRFERIGMFRGSTVYSDYAHHPSEIIAAIDTAKRILPDGKKLYVIFQPHTYSRTARLLQEFIKAFSCADECIIAKTYAARETPAEGVDSRELFRRIVMSNKFYYDTTLDIAGHLMTKVNPDDIVLIVGAGDIDHLKDLLVVT